MIVVSVFRESRVRGLHAFGIAYIDELKTLQVVCSTLYSDVIKSLLSLTEGQPLSLIGHTRYSTSGDWRNNENNQPIVADNSALVFNGVISQKSKDTYEQEFGVECATENDGEIFLKHSNKVTLLQTMKGSFAGVWIDKNRMFVARNKRRPLWFSNEFGATFIASTKNIFNRSGVNNCYEIVADKIIEVTRVNKDEHSSNISQQASAVFGIPSSYAEHRRYRPRVSCDVVHLR